MQTRDAVDRDLALVVGAARSGTTLTRLLLDAHPEIGCPSEAGIPALMTHLARVWLMVNADDAVVQTPADPGVRGEDGDAPARWEDTARDEDGASQGQATDPRPRPELPI